MTTYDANGNMISDKNKNITAIRYNHLNLPTEITFQSGDHILYRYNAAGQKISKFVSAVNASNTVKTVEYLDGFQYTGGELNFFPHAEGYVNVTLGTTGNRIFNYVYNYTDHLGNIRLSYTKDVVDNKLKILDENHYYPFGLKHQKYTAAGSIGLKAIDESTARPATLTSTPYNYKYNGQEWQDELGLNMYDMDMRQYDPAIARWIVMDPVIHHSMSPYNAFDNNPVFWADPSGADSVFDQEGTSVSSLTNMSTGFSISAGGAGDNNTDKTSALAKAASNAGANGNGKSATGSVSAEWTAEDDAQFPPNEPGTTQLPVVVARNSAELNAGLENRANQALAIWSNTGSSNYFDKINWGVGIGATGMEKFSGATRVGWKNGGIKTYGALSYEPYLVGTRQFQRSTVSLSKIGKGLGFAGFMVGTLMDFNKWNNGQISGKKFGLNAGMGAIGFTAVGAPASILYGTVEAIHPQGWEGYSKDYQSLQAENAAINPGFITAPYGSQKF